MILGIDSLLSNHQDLLDGARYGLLMNRASVNGELALSCDLLKERCRGELVSLFTPQHGLWGDAQANMIESPHRRCPRLGVRVHSLYSETRCPTGDMLADIDLLLIDLQDVGTRVYTFHWTVQACLRACVAHDVKVVLLDRPNPLGGSIIEGPRLNDSFRSFVGGAAIPMRHGLSIGEMAAFLNQSIGAELTVIPMEDWDPDQVQSTSPWIPPSPNLPSWESTLLYPGQVLLEGTNLSEGRGTTTPFQFIGAPFIDAAWLYSVASQWKLPGVKFLLAEFEPTFDKWSGQLCQGVSIHVTNPDEIRSYELTMRLLETISQRYIEGFEWIDPPYEYENERMPIDIIAGSDQLRRGLGKTSVEQFVGVDVSDWRESVKHCLQYSRQFRS